MNLKAIRLQILIFWEYLKRYFRWVLGVGITLFIIITVVLRFNFFNQSELRIGLIGTYQEHDLPTELTSLISSSLVGIGDEGKVYPKLVTGWEVNNNATEFKFKLKEGLTWSDNSKVKAEDLLFDIPNIGESAPDERTVQFNLKQPYVPLPSLLTNPILKKGTLTGTGLYKIQKIEKSRIFITKIVLEPKDKKMPNITVRFYPNEKVAITGFNLGEVQAIMDLGNLKTLTTTGFKTKQTTDYSKIVTLLFNTTDPLLRNRSFRQALAYSSPLIENEENADNPYPPLFWARDPKAKRYINNPEEAKDAIKRARNSLSDEQLKSELTLTTTPNLEEVGKEIAESWKKLGFETKLRIESGIPQNFQALLITQSIPDDPDQYFLWHATQTKTNLSKYDSKRTDKDLEDGRKVISEEDRKNIYFDFQTTLLEDAPAVFLYYPKYNIIYLKKAEPLLNKILDLQV